METDVLSISIPPGGGVEAATVRRWFKKAGEAVAAGEAVVELETVDALVVLQAKVGGVLAEAVAGVGKTVRTGEVVGKMGGNVKHETPNRKPIEAGKEVKMGAVVQGVVVPVLMPQAGNTMEEGTIVKWRVAVGDRIAVGQIICEIETDKATVEMEATDAGRVAKILAGEGAVVPVKQAMALLAEEGVDVDAVVSGQWSVVSGEESVAEGQGPEEGKRHTKQETRNAEHAAAVVGEGGRVKASPAARKLATEKGVDLAAVGMGSGPGGRILSTDVAGASAGGGRTSTGLPSGAPGRKTMSKMRRAIANNLQMSKQTIPHFYVRLTIDAGPLMSFYKAQKAATGCTLNDVVLLAVGRCVQEFAAFRSRVEGNDLVETPAANIGVAVSVADGLVVPVVLDVGNKTLAQLAPEARRVAEAARAGKIENMGKGVFTISNMGMLGVEEFAAIINPPESGILAISAAREDVIVKDGTMRPGRVMTMTLSVDHRVVDGALAAAFMAKLKGLLEGPEKI